jgi:hypothetical protein
MRNLMLGAAALLAAFAAAPAAMAYTGHADASYATDDDGNVDTIGVGAVVAFDANALGVQLDFDYANSSGDDGFGDSDFVGIGGHVYTQNNKYLIGGYAGYNNVSPDDGDDFDSWMVAAEGQYYLDRTTLGATVFYNETDAAGDPSATGVQGDVKHFYGDNFAVGANLGWASFDSDFGDDDGWSAGVGAEYQLASTPVSFFGGWQHSDSDDGDELDVLGVGARWNFGGQSLFDRNRSGGDLKRYNSLPVSFGVL